MTPVRTRTAFRAGPRQTDSDSEPERRNRTRLAALPWTGPLGRAAAGTERDIPGTGAYVYLLSPVGWRPRPGPPVVPPAQPPQRLRQGGGAIAWRVPRAGSSGPWNKGLARREWRRLSSLNLLESYSRRVLASDRDSESQSTCWSQAAEQWPIGSPIFRSALLQVPVHSGN